MKIMHVACGGAGCRTRATACTRLTACCALMLAGASPSLPEDKLPLPEDTYFEEYGKLYDHIGMLQDDERMNAYHSAIQLNADAHFKGKVILDVGAGTGILSIWAAQAGAARVYAVEATPVAQHAKALVKAHGLSGTVTVLHGKMEELELPEKVDVILSEWMGYFLLRESMVQSVLLARDRWLKPSGVLYPSHCDILIASLHEEGYAEARAAELAETMASWDALTAGMLSKYSLNFDALRPAYEHENREYSYTDAWQGAIGAGAVVGTPQTLLSVDMRTTTMEELFGWHRTVTLDLPHTLPAGGVAAPGSVGDGVGMLCGWFESRFCADEGGRGGDTGDGSGDAGSDGNGASGRESRSCVELSTSPLAPYTHWAHTTFLLDPPLTAPFAVSIGLTQSAKSHHDLNVTIAYPSSEGAQVSAHHAITADFRSGPRTPADGLGDEQGGIGSFYDDYGDAAAYDDE